MILLWSNVTELTTAWAGMLITIRSKMKWKFNVNLDLFLFFQYIFQCRQTALKYSLSLLEHVCSYSRTMALFNKNKKSIILLIKLRLSNEI